ncbi:MAG: 3'-5' exonuclease, partial [Bacteroidia bacterium]
YSTIIEFNNLLFSELIKNLNDYQKEIYKDVAQEKTDKHGGYVNVELYEGDEFVEKGKNFTLSSIKNALNSGFNPNEIAVLVRKRKEINAIAEFLIQNNIEVVSEESLKLTYSQDVKKIIESFKFLNNPNDSLQAIQLLLLLKPTIESHQIFELLDKKQLENYIEEHYQINHQLLNLSVLNA